MNSSNLKKITQISEESFPPVHVPILLGNEIFVVTQQDVRKIEETRTLSYSKLTKLGNLIPMDATQQDSSTCEVIFNAYQYLSQMSGQPHPGSPNVFNNLMELLASLRGAQANMNRSNIATIDQQMNWEDHNISPRFPLSYSKCTSTSELKPTLLKKSTQTVCNRGVNTSATFANSPKVCDDVELKERKTSCGCSKKQHEQESKCNAENDSERVKETKGDDEFRKVDEN